MELEKLSVKDLQAKLVELGMPEDDVKAFKTKAPLISSIRTLEAKDAVKESDEEEEVKKVKSITETPKPREEKQVNARHYKKATAMKERLLQQPTVSILIPLEAGEKVGVVSWAYDKKGQSAKDKTRVMLTDAEWNALSLEEKMKTYQVVESGAFESVQPNGYKWFIAKGRYTPVPQQIAEIVSRSQQQTIDAGADIKLDRIDPRTGRPINEII